MRRVPGIPHTNASRNLVIGLLTLALALTTVHAAHGTEGAASETVLVPVAARAIVRGAVLTADDIAFEDRQIARGVTIDRSIAPGWVARRVISRGEILRAPSVQPPLAVAAHAPLEIAYSSGSVAMSVRGVASRAASVGDHITARLEDGRQLDVIVVAPGKARLL